uniref:Chloride channel accessory 1 n=1 Tax=Cyprinus carpio TaxID=7962 RepID=A0A8C2CUI2_CYPCA
VAVHLNSAAMDSTVMVVLLWILLPSTTTGIKLDGNGYVDVIIAISSRVPQDDTLIDKIKEMVTEGSFSLYDALNKKVYFREVTILVPPQWNGTNFTKARTESFGKAKIRIDNANPAYGVEPYTNQYGECGAEGEYIHFTPEYLLNDTFIHVCFFFFFFFFFFLWAHLRWGVYDEYNRDKPFYHSNSHIEATRCSEKTGGQFFDVTAGGSLQPCRIDPQTSLPTKGCIFFPNRNQITNCSIMFSPSLDPVTAFCQKNKHNYEAQSMLNKKCGKATWTVIFEDSVDKDALQTLKPLESPLPPPSFKVVQRAQRVVCLILDVSRSLNLIKLLPNVASGSTNMCLGLSRGLQVLQEDNGDVLGDEIIFLTDGQATDNIAGCAPSAIQSGAIIHTLAFSNSAAHALTEMANKTGGIFLAPNDNIISNQLMDAFASLSLSTGDYTNKPVQLESVGARTSDWFNGTVSVDQTVGNKTSFVIIYEISLPSIFIQSPSGSIYTQTNMSNDDLYKTVTLKVLGTAEPGDWKYSIQTTSNQAFTITVTSQAAHDVVPPIIVKTHMNQQFNDGIKPMTVYAEVSQNYRPVINAEVWATLESETGLTHTLQLLDNGAGADAFKDDGVYSRFFTKMLNGRSSLKVRVKNQDGQTRFAVAYVPGYVINGVVQLNPPKPPVSEEPLEVGNFTRTATGESFEVKLSGTTPLNFPPNRITDLSAEIQKDTVLLSWTAPGEDLDQGTAKSYEIRWSFDLDMLRSSFSNGHAVNTAGISPQKAGSDEKYSFNLSFPIQNCITVFFAVQSKDNQNATSETSNIAQASKIPPGPPGVSNPCINLIILVISVIILHCDLI